MKVAALSRQGKRNDLTSPHFAAKFRSDDEAAKDKIRAADYQRVYLASSFPDLTLDKLLKIFNRDNRPCGRSMRSLSTSDVVVLNQGGTKQTLYLGRYDFVEIPGFAEKLHEQKKLQAQQREAPALDDR